MSREIKFRVWDKLHNEWLGADAWYVRSSDSVLVIWPEVKGIDAQVSVHIETLGPERVAVQQYTGLKDKNGVEIYEGDLVDDHYFENHVSRHKVYWADSYGCWSTLGLKDPVVDRKQLAYFNETKNLHRNEYLEVIGNIYENPELMEDLS